MLRSSTLTRAWAWDSRFARSGRSSSPGYENGCEWPGNKTNPQAKNPKKKKIRIPTTSSRSKPSSGEVNVNGGCDIPLFAYHVNARGLFGGAERKEVLRAFDGVLEAAEELLEVGAALDEIDVGGVDYEKVGGGVVKEEVLVGAGDFFDVFERDLGFVAGGFFGDAGAQDFGLGLEIDDEIGRGNFGGQAFRSSGRRALALRR